jgi:two-component system CheB/CheR fusion protein
MDCGMLYWRRSIFNRHLPDRFLGEKLHKKIQIFASNISEKAIKKARAEFILRPMLEYFLRHDSKNYFTKNGDGYE